MPEILPHPKRGTMEIGTERIMPIFGAIRAAEGSSNDNPVVTIVGTDGSEDRHGSVINPRGWRTAAYLRNPVALWSHGVVEEYPALGQTLALRSVGGTWEFDIRFALGPWKNMRDNLAQFLWEWYRDFGGPLASSVGFIPDKWTDRQATEMPSFFAENVEYTEQELTEISFVNVPSNRNALAKAIERSRSAGTFTDGMAKMLGFSISPIIVPSRTEPPVAAPPPVPPETTAGAPDQEGVSKRMPLATLRSVIGNAREAMRYCYPDACSPCEPCVEYCDLCGAIAGTCNCDEVFTGDTATAELQTITSVIEVTTQALSVALAGWDSAEHDALRDHCSYLVWDSMWRIDRMLAYQDYWYPDQQEQTTVAVDQTQVRKFIAGVAADPELKRQLIARRDAILAYTRVGAELSSKNQTLIRAMHDHASEVVTTCRTMLGIADDATDGTARIFIPVTTSGPSSPGGEEGAGQTIRVSATDAPDAGAGDRSTHQDQPDLYGHDVLRVKA